MNEPASPQSLAPISAPEFLDQEIPPRKCLLQPWLPEGGVCLVTAAAGVGKTIFSMHVVKAVAEGRRLLTWHAPASRRVLYVDGEMHPSDLQQRVQKIIGRRREVSLLSGVQQSLPDLRDKQSWMQLSDGNDLVVFDNLSSLTNGGDGAKDWAPVADLSKALARRGQSVLLVHHFGKNKANGPRGTSRRLDGMDAAIELTRSEAPCDRDGVRLIIEFTKNRGFGGDDARTIEATLRLDGTSEDHGDPTSVRERQLQGLLEKGLNQTQAAAELGVSKATVTRTMQRLRSAGSAKTETKIIDLTKHRRPPIEDETLKS